LRVVVIPVQYAFVKYFRLLVGNHYARPGHFKLFSFAACYPAGPFLVVFLFTPVVDGFVLEIFYDLGALGALALLPFGFSGCASGCSKSTVIKNKCLGVI
jgi:hypothetical protein